MLHFQHVSITPSGLLLVGTAYAYSQMNLGIETRHCFARRVGRDKSGPYSAAARGPDLRRSAVGARFIAPTVEARFIAPTVGTRFIAPTVGARFIAPRHERSNVPVSQCIPSLFRLSASAHPRRFVANCERGSADGLMLSLQERGRQHNP